MHSKFWIQVVVGGVVFMAVSFVVGLATTGLQESMSGSATGVERDSPLWAWLALSAIVFGVLLATVLGWTESNDPASGFKTAATLGFLFSLGLGMTFYAFSNLVTLMGALVSPLLAIVEWGAAGAVVGMLRGKSAS